jgi:D-alanine-D-alanine ligase
MTKPVTVLLLAGGDSPERDVSLDSSKGIHAALCDAGYRVLVADPGRPELAPSEDAAEVFASAGIMEEPPDMNDDPFTARAEFARILSGYQAWGIDIVFNGLHGGVGEDGTLQAVLEYLGIPFTGSSSAACALAMDKHRAKQLASEAGVPVPRGLCFQTSALATGTIEQSVRENLGVPLVVKPNCGGSSVGLSVVDDYAGIDEAAARAFEIEQNILIEEFIAGRELTQSFLDGASDVPVLEIRPRSGLYDYYHKYQPGNSEYLVPAPIEESVAAAVAESARRTVHALGLSVYGRVDFRLDEENKHYLLEANSLPGMTATSLVPKACAVTGIDYQELCDRIVKLSLASWTR